MTSWIVTIPDHLKTQEMCKEAVRTEPLSLAYVPDCFKTQKMGIKVVKKIYACCYLSLIIFGRKKCALR